MNWQFHFLGWRPSFGEVLFLVILALFPWWNWLSRAWDFLLDRTASLFDKFKIRRIKSLELQIKRLNEYNDRKALIWFLRKITTFIFSLGLFIVAVVIGMNLGVTLELHRITDFFQIPSLAFLGLSSNGPSLFAQEVIFLLYNIPIMLGPPLLLLFAMSTFREMGDFSDPPEAINRLEERIGALRAKARNQTRNDLPQLKRT